VDLGNHVAQVEAMPSVGFWGSSVDDRSSQRSYSTIDIETAPFTPSMAKAFHKRPELGWSGSGLADRALSMSRQFRIGKFPLQEETRVRSSFCECIAL
jgi:hypothetical protein